MSANGDRLKRKRKFVAFILCWAGLTVLTLIAVIKSATPVEPLKVYAGLLPWLLVVYGGANVAKAWVERNGNSQGGQTP